MSSGNERASGLMKGEMGREMWKGQSAFLRKGELFPTLISDRELILVSP